jgi:hypothetical protein
MSIVFQDTARKVSDTLSETARAIPSEGMTLRQLLGTLGEQGLLLFCIFLTVPFLLPVQIPGLSTVFGLLIAVIAVGVTINRIPRFPQWLMEHHVPAKHLSLVLEHGARLFARVERWVCPRWLAFTHRPIMNRVTGLFLLLAAVLLTLPLLLPFSNMLPALAIFLLTVGILQRDGLFILCGYVVILGTVVYFAGVALVAIHSLHFVTGITWLVMR